MQKNGNKLGNRKRNELLASVDSHSQADPAIPAGGKIIREDLVAEQITFQGPLPPPVVLAEYEKLHPGLASKIVALAETQSAHRQEMEKASAKAIIDDTVASRRERRLGQIIGGIVVVLAILGGVALGVWGNSAWANAPAATITGIPLVGVVIALITGKRNGNGHSK